MVEAAYSYSLPCPGFGPKKPLFKYCSVIPFQFQVLRLVLGCSQDKTALLLPWVSLTQPVDRKRLGCLPVSLSSGLR